MLLVLIDSKKMELLDISYFLKNQTYPNTKHFDTTCSKMV